MKSIYLEIGPDYLGVNKIVLKAESVFANMSYFIINANYIGTIKTPNRLLLKSMTCREVSTFMIAVNRLCQVFYCNANTYLFKTGENVSILKEKLCEDLIKSGYWEQSSGEVKFKNAIV